MNRIEELKKEIELTKELIELRKQLAVPGIVTVPIYVHPYQPPCNPWVMPQFPAPYIGDPIPHSPMTTWGGTDASATC